VLVGVLVPLSHSASRHGYQPAPGCGWHIDGKEIQSGIINCAQVRSFFPNPVAQTPVEKIKSSLLDVSSCLPRSQVGYLSPHIISIVDTPPEYASFHIDCFSPRTYSSRNWNIGEEKEPAVVEKWMSHKLLGQRNRRTEPMSWEVVFLHCSSPGDGSNELSNASIPVSGMLLFSRLIWSKTSKPGDYSTTKLVVDTLHHHPTIEWELSAFGVSHVHPVLLFCCNCWRRKEIVGPYHFVSVVDKSTKNSGMNQVSSQYSTNSGIIQSWLQCFDSTHCQCQCP